MPGFNIMDMIAALTGGQDPNQAVVQAAGGVPQQAAPQQAQQQMPPIPDSTVPQGVKTPVTNPMPPQATPNAVQSPPDLANMYAALMQKNQNAQQLDSGLTLMAAGLSNNLGTRQALIQSAAGGGGKAGMSLSASDMINFQKQADAQRQQLIMQQALPALMKQYKMTPAQIQALQASGQLGDVIKHYSTENLGITEDAETGQKTLFNQRSGNVVAKVGGEKPDETMEVTDPNTGVKYLANKRTGEKIKDLVGATKPEETIVVKGPQGEELRSKVDFRPIGTPAGPTEANVDAKGTQFPALDKGFDYARDEKGLVKLTDGKPTVAPMAGSTAEKALVDEQQKKVEQKIQSASTLASVSSASKAIQTALDEATIPGAVGLGSKIYMQTVGQLGGTAGNIVRDNLDTIKANASFEKLAQMRQASPTGGALGNISDFENKLLSSATATLSPNLRADQLIDNVHRVQATMELIASKKYSDEKTFNADLEKRLGELKLERANKAPANKGITVTRD